MCHFPEVFTLLSTEGQLGEITILMVEIVVLARAAREFFRIFASKAPENSIFLACGVHGLPMGRFLASLGPNAGFLSSLPEILDLVQGGKLRYLVWYSKQTSYGIYFLYKLLSINIYQHRMCSAMCSCSCSWAHCRKAHAIHTAHIHMHRASNACMPTLPNVHWAPPCDIHPHSMHHRLPHCICSIRGSRPPSRIPTHPAI